MFALTQQSSIATYHYPPGITVAGECVLIDLFTSTMEPPRAKAIGAAPPGSAITDPNDPRFKLPLWPASSRIHDDDGESQTFRQYPEMDEDNGREASPALEPPESDVEEDEELQIESPSWPVVQAEAARLGNMAWPQTTPLITYESESARRLREKMPQYATDSLAGGVTTYTPVPVNISRYRIYLESFHTHRINSDFNCAEFEAESTKWAELPELWRNNYNKRTS